MLITDIRPTDLRLCDLGEHDNLVVECGRCARIVEITHRRRLVTGWTKDERKITELKLKCRNCGALDGFGLSIEDERDRGAGQKQVAVITTAMKHETTKNDQPGG